ncbi:MAG: hypothetical protein JWL76_119 [Thermoleophilia bacterium]|nr:hypothetical protein [Thermoleophilia bacterium]
MSVMSDSPRDTRAPKSEEPRRRDHLSLVAEPVLAAGAVPAPRPRSIGRLIAQTALIADSAVSRRRAELPETRGMTGRLFGRFR